MNYEPTRIQWKVRDPGIVSCLTCSYNRVCYTTLGLDMDGTSPVVFGFWVMFILGGHEP